MYFRKKYIEKYDLQENYNYLNIKFEISFCESGLWSQHHSNAGRGISLNSPSTYHMCRFGREPRYLAAAVGAWCNEQRFCHTTLINTPTTEY